MKEIEKSFDMTYIKENKLNRCQTTTSTTDALMNQILRTKKSANQTQKLIKQMSKVLISVCSKLSRFSHTIS